MSQKRSERVNFLICNFMLLHNQGLSIPEIAEKSAVTTRTVYTYLQEIADINNVSRESLLEKVHNPHEVTKFTPRKKIPKVDAENLINRYLDVIRTAEDLKEVLHNILNQEEK